MTQTSNILKYPEKMNNVSSVLCLLCHMFSSPLSLKNQSLGDSLKTEVIGKHPLYIPVRAPLENEEYSIERIVLFPALV